MILLAPAALLAAIAAELLEERHIARVRQYAGSGLYRRLRPEIRLAPMRWNDSTEQWAFDVGSWQDHRARVLGLIGDRPIRAFVALLMDMGKPIVSYQGPGGDPTGFALAQAGLDETPTGFYEARHGDWVVQLEGWKDACLDSGFGPWSDVGPARETDWEPPCEDEGPTFLQTCMAEADLRKSGLPMGRRNPDAAPDGTWRWVVDLWVPSGDPSYTLTQISIYEIGPLTIMPRTLLVDPPSRLYRGVRPETSWQDDWSRPHGGIDALPVTTLLDIARDYAGRGGIVLVLEPKEGTRWLTPTHPWPRDFQAARRWLFELVAQARAHGLAGVKVDDHWEGSWGHHLVDRSSVEVVALLEVPG